MMAAKVSADEVTERVLLSYMLLKMVGDGRNLLWYGAKARR